MAAAPPQTPNRAVSRLKARKAATSPRPAAPSSPMITAPKVKPMTIGIYHGYELTGSGSNEYTRYIARGLARLGHHVHVLCRDTRPAALPFVRSAVLWSLGGAGGLTASSELMFLRDEADLPSKETARGGTVTVHVLPHSSIRPVFVCDKQREGNVKAFIELSDSELREYHRTAVAAVKAVLERVPMQIVHANHLVYQPTVCVDACRDVGVPFIIFPHGSSIEYTVHRDARYAALAKEAVAAAALVISGSHEVAGRIEGMYTGVEEQEALEAFKAKVAIVGVGTDTSLFRDVGFGKRATKIRNVESYSHMFGGKAPKQSEELYARLGATEDEAEWRAAMRGYKTAYNHKLPDTDFLRELEAMPWTHRDSVSRAPMVLFVGSMTFGKGVQTLIVAFTEMLSSFPDGHLLLIGSGSFREVLEALVFALDTGNEKLLDYIVEQGRALDERNDDAPASPLADLAHYLADAERRTKLLAAARGSDLRNHIHFLGRVNHDILSCVFPCVDIAVFPSMLSEAYPLVLMESLANGVVPVLPDQSGFSESLRSLREPMGDSFVDSITMPSETEQRVSGLIGVLRGLVDSLDDVRALTPKLRSIATSKYDWTMRCVEMTEAYASVARDVDDSYGLVAVKLTTAGGVPLFADADDESSAGSPASAASPRTSTLVASAVGGAIAAVAVGVLLGLYLGRRR